MDIVLTINLGFKQYQMKKGALCFYTNTDHTHRLYFTTTIPNPPKKTPHGQRYHLPVMISSAIFSASASIFIVSLDYTDVFPSHMNAE